MTTLIRLATPADAPQVLDIYAPFITDTPVSFEYVVPTVDEIARRISSILETHPWLILERDGEALGYVYASPHSGRAAYDWCVNVSVYTAANHRRAGVGRTLYTSLFELLRLMGYYNAYAGITLPNAASVGLHETMGFSLIGVYRKIGYKFGQWHDVGWWQMELQPRNEEPSPPILMPQAVGGETIEGWEAARNAGLALLPTSQYSQHPAGPDPGDQKR